MRRYIYNAHYGDGNPIWAMPFGPEEGPNAKETWGIKPGFNPGNRQIWFALKRGGVPDVLRIHRCTK
jgi:hypothetical protein